MFKSGVRAVFAVSLAMTGCAPVMLGDDASAEEDARIVERDAATSSDAGSEIVVMDSAVEAAIAQDAAAASDGSAEAASDSGEVVAENSADWIIGTWQRAGERPILTTGNNDVLTVNVAADGVRRFRFQTYDSRASLEGTWRALSGGRVELRAIGASPTVLDRSSVLANCELVVFEGTTLRRWNASAPSCPFARPITDRECSLEGRQYSWMRPGTGDGQRFTVSLQSNRVGFYLSTFQRLIGCVGECTYSTIQDPIQYFEWGIEGDRLQIGGVAIPVDAFFQRTSVGACRASTFYTAPTNLDGERCGDGLCRGLETSVDCPADCGYAPDQRCPVGSRCSSEQGDRTCASNSPGGAEGTCLPTCVVGNSACASACCGAFTAGEANACFPASVCNDSAPRCREMDQPCTSGWDCCSVAGRASVCVTGLNSANPDAGVCRPGCFTDADCGRDAYCSCRLSSGRRTCSRSRTGC